jgi:hypothetical protein
MARDYAKLIGHLIANAENEGNSPEARTAYRLKAEELMREYRIAEEETIATDQFSVLPGRFEVVLMESGAYFSEMKSHYLALFREIAKHAGVRFVAEYRWADDERRNYDECSLVAVTYGYEMDVRLAEFYWTAARLVFMTRIDARVDRKLSDQENCYYLRNSGVARIDIAAMLWGEETRTKAAPHAKVQKLYLAECAARGEEPKVAGRGIQVKLYREAYANAFVSEFGWRLREARDGADSTGGGLVLRGRKERVDEAFYEAYPNRRPMSAEERAAQEARWAAEEAAAGPCPACAVTKSKTGLCKRCRPTTYSNADYRRWDRQQNGPEARAGRQNGAAAARSVNVSRTAGPRTQSADAAPERTALGS